MRILKKLYDIYFSRQRGVSRKQGDCLVASETYLDATPRPADTYDFGDGLQPEDMIRLRESLLEEEVEEGFKNPKA